MNDYSERDSNGDLDDVLPIGCHVTTLKRSWTSTYAPWKSDIMGSNAGCQDVSSDKNQTSDSISRSHRVGGAAPKTVGPAPTRVGVRNFVSA